MKLIFKKLISNQIVTGSAVIVGGGLAANFLNFLFNVYMTRNLSVADYGILASMISLITLFSIPAGSMTPTIVRFGASYFANNQLDQVRGLFLKIVRFTALVGFGILLIFIFFSKSIGDFFRIDNPFLIILAGVIIFFSYIGTINSGLLQAKLLFTFISIMNSLSNLLKLIVGVALVFSGFKVNGALTGFAVSYFLPYFLSFIPFRFIFNKSINIPKISNAELFKYGTPAALALFGLSSFITTDIILVKHFFDPHQAGIYSGMSLIGRVIYFLTAPIGTVMFPLVVQKHSRNEKYDDIFALAMILVAVPAGAITVFYFLFPEFTINFFAKSDYQSASGYLGLFGLFTMVFSIISVITNYFLSISKTIIAIPIIIAAIIQAAAIWLFHDSFYQIILNSLVIAILLLIFELIFYFLPYGRKTK